MNHLRIYAKGADRPYFVCPDTPEYRKWHYPQHTGLFAWVLKNDAGEVIDHYNPPKKERK